jgi:hypothetical protein
MLPLVDQLYLEFGKLIGDNLIEEWLDTPNVQLDFRTPRNLIEKRDFAPLWSLLYESQEKVPS